MIGDPKKRSKTDQNWPKMIKKRQKTRKSVKNRVFHGFSWKRSFIIPHKRYRKCPIFSYKLDGYQSVWGHIWVTPGIFGENTSFLRFLTVLTKTQNLGYSLALKFLYPKVPKVTYFDQNRQFWHLNREFVRDKSHFRQKRHFGPKPLTNLLYNVKNVQKWSNLTPRWPPKTMPKASKMAFLAKNVGFPYSSPSLSQNCQRMRFFGWEGDA